MNVPSSAYTKWHKDASVQVRAQGLAPITDQIQKIELVFRMPDNRRADLTNKAESVMDLLVDCGIIKDDCWQVVPYVHIRAEGIDRENPGVDVTISSVGA